MPPGRTLTLITISELKAKSPFLTLSGSFLKKDVIVKRFTGSAIVVYNGKSMEPNSSRTQPWLRAHNDVALNNRILVHFLYSFIAEKASTGNS